MRMIFKFWLDTDKPDESDLIGVIPEMKRRRLFTPTLRDGIRLIRDLRAGQVDVLTELFPWVLNNRDNGSGSEGQGGYVLPDGTDNALIAQIDRLENLIMQQVNVPAAAIVPPIPANNLPELQSKKAKTNGQSRQNLLDAMAGIAGTQKITIKPEAKKTPTSNIIAGSDVELSAPYFSGLAL